MDLVSLCCSCCCSNPLSQQNGGACKPTAKSDEHNNDNNREEAQDTRQYTNDDNKSWNGWAGKAMACFVATVFASSAIKIDCTRLSNAIKTTFAFLITASLKLAAIGVRQADMPETI